MIYPEKISQHRKYLWSFYDVPPYENDLVKIYTQAISYELPLHIHDFYELNIITKGIGRHYIGSKNVPTQKGDVFVIPPNVPHGYFDYGDLEILHILLSDKFMYTYSNLLKNLSGYKTLFETEPVLRRNIDTPFYLSLDSIQLKETDNYFKDAIFENKKHDPDKNCRQAFTVLCILGKLCEYMSTLNLKISQNSADKNNISVIKSIEYIESNFESKLSLHSIADKCCMSYSTYLRVFKNLTGTTPLKYQRECRMKNAKRLLSSSDDTVLSIALSSGYFDSAHFIREFIAYEGISPTQFRKNRKTAVSST